MPTWIDWLLNYLKTQGPGFVTGGIVGFVGLATSAVSRVIRDRYQARLNRHTATADACTRTIEALIRLEHAINERFRAKLMWEQPTAWSEDYEAIARFQALSSGPWAGDAFSAAAHAYLAFLSKMLRALDDGTWLKVVPTEEDLKLQQRMFDAVPAHVRARVVPGYLINLTDARHERRNLIIQAAMTKMRAVWRETDSAPGIQGSKEIMIQRK